MNSATATPSYREFLLALEKQCAAGSGGQVHKLDISREGYLQAQLQNDGDPLWVQWRQREAVILDPGLDRKIPLSTIMGDQERRGRLRTLNYRPRRRLVLLDTSGRQALVLKGFRKHTVRESYRRHAASRAAFAGRGIRAPEIIDCDDDLDCLVMAHVSGGPLPLSADKGEMFDLIGRALRNFQANVAGADMATFNSQDELAVIDRFDKKLSRIGLKRPGQWLSLKERLAAIEKDLPATVPGLCHRDLHDRQFILQGNDLTLLDFDLACTADVALDPANFLAHLRLRHVQRVRGATREMYEVCGQSFLRGLDRQTEAGFRERLCFYQATTFCRLALVYALRPYWSKLVPELVSMGHRCADELQHRRGG